MSSGDVQSNISQVEILEKHQPSSSEILEKEETVVDNEAKVFIKSEQDVKNIMPDLNCDTNNVKNINKHNGNNDECLEMSTLKDVEMTDASNGVDSHGDSNHNVPIESNSNGMQQDNKIDNSIQELLNSEPHNIDTNGVSEVHIGENECGENVQYVVYKIGDDTSGQIKLEQSDENEAIVIIMEQDIYEDVYVDSEMSTMQTIGNVINDGNTNTFVCNICNKIFNKFAIYNKHMSTHSNLMIPGAEKRFICEVCGKRYLYERTLREHQQLGHDTDLKPFKCPYCDKGYDLSNNLKYHMIWCTSGAKANDIEKVELKDIIHQMKVDTDKRIVSCVYCHNSVSNLQSVKRHMWITHKKMLNLDYPLKCPLCNIMYDSSFEFLIHLKSCTGSIQMIDGSNEIKTLAMSETVEKEKMALLNNVDYATIVTDVDSSNGYKCGLCNYVSSTYGGTRRHYFRTHENKPIPQPNSLKCAICETYFKSPGGLKAHMRHHNGKVSSTKFSLKCADCGRLCATPYALRAHRRIHTGEKPFKCEICSKSFRFSSELPVHMRLHSGSKPYRCDKCGRSFHQSSNFRRHEYTCSSGLVPPPPNSICHICNKSFSHSSSLTAHMRIHTGERPYYCKHCGKTFVQMSNKKRHEMSCAGCQGNSMICPVCSQFYNGMASLRAHMRRHSAESDKKIYQCCKCGTSLASAADRTAHEGTCENTIIVLTVNSSDQTDVPANVTEEEVVNSSTLVNNNVTI